jgi:hypothetical protein
MLTSILFMIAAVVVGFAILIAFQKTDFRTVRSTIVSAPAATAFAQINDLRLYANWNPWRKYDPAMKTAYDGPATGRGAVLSWVGNGRVGAGSMTIVESEPNQRVLARLDFLKPFPSTCTGEFTFEPRGGGNQTVVTWAMFGKRSFIPKAFGLFINMDKMVGDEFEKGLAEMKAIVEAPGPRLRQFIPVRNV